MKRGKSKEWQDHHRVSREAEKETKTSLRMTRVFRRIDKDTVSEKRGTITIRLQKSNQVNQN